MFNVKPEDLLLYATGLVLWSTLVYYVVIEPIYS